MFLLSVFERYAATSAFASTMSKVMKIWNHATTNLLEQSMQLAHIERIDVLMADSSNNVLRTSLSSRSQAVKKRRSSYIMRNKFNQTERKLRRCSRTRFPTPQKFPNGNKKTNHGTPGSQLCRGDVLIWKVNMASSNGWRCDKITLDDAALENVVIDIKYIRTLK